MSIPMSIMSIVDGTIQNKTASLSVAYLEPENINNQLPSFPSDNPPNQPIFRCCSVEHSGHLCWNEEELRLRFKTVMYETILWCTSITNRVHEFGL